MKKMRRWRWRVYVKLLAGNCVVDTARIIGIWYLDFPSSSTQWFDSKANANDEAGQRRAAEVMRLVPLPVPSVRSESAIRRITRT